MAVQPLLCLLPPGNESPTKPTVYKSPARSMCKREVFRVEKSPSIQRLMLQKAQEKGNGRIDFALMDAQQLGLAAATFSELSIQMLKRRFINATVPTSNLQHVG